MVIFFEGGHRAKNGVLTPNTVFFVTMFYEYILLIFALRLGLILKVVGLDVELNSASNGDIFEGCHWAKKD
jgi:hypothetical protein